MNQSRQELAKQIRSSLSGNYENQKEEEEELGDEYEDEYGGGEEEEEYEDEYGDEEEKEEEEHGYEDEEEADEEEEEEESENWKRPDSGKRTRPLNTEEKAMDPFGAKLSKRLHLSDYRVVEPLKTKARTKIKPNIIYKFDPVKHMPRYGTAVFVGHTRSGKTRTMWNMMAAKRKEYDTCLVFVGTEESAIEFSRFVPDSFIYSGLGVDYEKLVDLVVDQELDVREKKKPQSVLLIFDDFSFDASEFNRSKVISWLFKNGRHANIMVYIATQYYTDLCRAYRTNVKIALIQRENNVAYLDSLYRSYNTCFPNFRVFQETLLLCTENFGTMVLLNDPSKTDVSELVFHFRSNPDIKFRMCPDSIMWDYHHARYVPGYFKRKEVAEKTKAVFMGGKGGISAANAAANKRNATKGQLPTDGFACIENYVFLDPNAYDKTKHEQRIKKLRRKPIAI